MLKSSCGKVEWADLKAIDLSKAKTLEGRKGLVKQVHDAMKNDGFLFVTNHSVTPEQVGSYVNPALL
jgi:isopenicillin N synthase-like dioxygenase